MTTDNVTTASINSNQINVSSTNDPQKQLGTLTDIIDQSIRYFESSSFTGRGQLVVVGGGIKAISDMTLDAEAQVRAAQKVLYGVADPVTERRLHALNRSAESLYGLYGDDKPRMDTYLEMLETIMAPDCASVSCTMALRAYSRGRRIKPSERLAAKAFAPKCIPAFPRMRRCSRISVSILISRAVTRSKRPISSFVDAHPTSARTSCSGRWSVSETSGSTSPATSGTTSTS